MKKVLITVLAVAICFGIAVAQRHTLVLYALSLAETPSLSAPLDEGPGVRWHDDYFTVQALDSRTFAIGEPRYFQQNYSYLILGDDRAVLFDAGPGYRDIRAVAESLTELPVTFIPSHFHYDHVGNEITFDRVAVVDLPYLRARAPEGRLQLTSAEHLGRAEGIAAPSLAVDEWLAPNSHISLGNRTLQVLHTPGHTEDSISLLDVASGAMWSGDFIYPGPLIAMLSNSGMGDYLQGANTVLSANPTPTRIFGAHRVAPPGAPELSTADVRDLQSALRAIRAGEQQSQGIYPVIYRINARLDLWAEPTWLQNWSPRHPPPESR